MSLNITPLIEEKLKNKIHFPKTNSAPRSQTFFFSLVHSEQRFTTSGCKDTGIDLEICLLILSNHEIKQN